MPSRILSAKTDAHDRSLSKLKTEYEYKVSRTGTDAKAESAGPASSSFRIEG